MAIDLGTSSVRASAYDVSANAIPNCSATVSLSFSYTTDGGAFGNPTDIANSVEICVDQLLSLCHDQDLRILAVGMDVIAGTYVGLNVNDEPITDLFTYAETRSFEQATVLREDSIPSLDIQKTGVPVHSAYFPSIYKWLKDTNYLRINPVLWTDIGGFLFKRWFAQSPFLSFSIASWMGLMDRSTGTINKALLEVLDLNPDSFPEPKPYDQALVGLSEIFAKRWPILEEVPF
ncbi:MAG: FGGY family carbohydrate kinase, partial [Chloroflexota bacterium]|nr:FGGY family carbohydrate kinase [Chloroflexota bacterium]